MAIYDLRNNQINIFKLGTESIALVCASKTLRTDRRPMHLCWVGDSTLVLTDSIASVWIYRLDARNLQLIGEGRLGVKGIVSVSPARDACSSFLVGQSNGCSMYRIVSETEDRCSIELLSLDALEQGNVRQVLPNQAGELEYLCSNNASAAVIDQFGQQVRGAGTFRFILS